MRGDTIMAYDGFVNYAVAHELSNTLIGGKINKVYQPNKDTLLLQIYTNGQRYHLFIGINTNACRVNLTEETAINPTTPYSFCMLLRKHLVGARIKEITTNGLDRVMHITVDSYNEMNDLSTKTIVIELMGRHSNVILINDKDIIIDSMRHIASSDARTILPANPYEAIPSEKLDLLTITKKDFVSALATTENLEEALPSKFLGMSKRYAHYLLGKLSIPPTHFTLEEIETLYDEIQRILSHIPSGNVHCIKIDGGNKKDYVLDCDENGSNLDVNHFIDIFYAKKEKAENFENYRNNVLKVMLGILKKYTNRLKSIDRKLEECKQMDQYQLYGELITSHLYQIDNTVNVSSITLSNYYTGEDISIPLDSRYSPAQNAKLFFKKYNKLKTAFALVTDQKKDTKRELQYIESIIYSLENASTVQEVDDIYLEIKENLLHETKVNSNKKKESSQPMILQIEQHTVYVGKNNKQNDELTFKIASKNDIWFHAKDIHGSHVILKKDGDISDGIISKCASLAAYYSKARETSKVEVQYTQVKNLRKPKHSNPGFVVISTYNSIMVEPSRFDL